MELLAAVIELQLLWLPLQAEEALVYSGEAGRFLLGEPSLGDELLAAHLIESPQLRVGRIDLHVHPAAPPLDLPVASTPEGVHRVAILVALAAEKTPVGSTRSLRMMAPTSRQRAARGYRKQRHADWLSGR
eukprot:CAMPEP_0180639242 /NCGR_PEP_ID=MMETSP1037_2-20121125/44857_1 /TAXON_ID=632150 /ORGANISM="Azadinium spinosum, Strain 3D9" /LENGTH=130 /DNA_ID=CAMNT_0022661031 /DNA_START=93 /DNA_END=482 /DNA_ORIENTATION=+